MKPYLIFIFVILLACREEINHKTKCGEEFELKSGEKKLIACGNTEEGESFDSITINVLNITENRCCAACLCITAGSAKAEIEITANQVSKIAELRIGDSENGYKTQDSTIIGINNRNIKVILKDISPFPMNAEDNSENQFAKIQVKY